MDKGTRNLLDKHYMVVDVDHNTIYFENRTHPNYIRIDRGEGINVLIFFDLYLDSSTYEGRMSWSWNTRHHGEFERAIVEEYFTSRYDLSKFKTIHK